MDIADLVNPQAPPVTSYGHEIKLRITYDGYPMDDPNIRESLPDALAIWRDVLRTNGSKRIIPPAEIAKQLAHNFLHPVVCLNIDPAERSVSAYFVSRTDPVNPSYPYLIEVMVDLHSPGKNDVIREITRHDAMLSTGIGKQALANIASLSLQHGAGKLHYSSQHNVPKLLKLGFVRERPEGESTLAGLRSYAWAILTEKPIPLSLDVSSIFRMAPFLNHVGAHAEAEEKRRLGWEKILQERHKNSKKYEDLVTRSKDTEFDGVGIS